MVPQGAKGVVRCPLFSVSCPFLFHCHGRGRGFEPHRPRQILKDLSPIWSKDTEETRLENSWFLTPCKQVCRKGSHCGSLSRFMVQLASGRKQRRWQRRGTKLIAWRFDPPAGMPEQFGLTDVLYQ
jgi:hypothetical protein